MMNGLLQTIPLTSEQLKAFWDKESNIIAFECSDVDLMVPDKKIELYNLDTDKSKQYEYYKLDRSDSGFDVAGWWFKPVDKSDNQKVLIIND